MIVRQLDDGGQHLVGPPAGGDSTVDETCEGDVKRFLTPHEAFRVTFWNIGWIYVVHLMKMTGALESVKKPEPIASRTKGAASGDSGFRYK